MDSLWVSRPVNIRLWIAAVIVTLSSEAAPMIWPGVGFVKFVAAPSVVGLLPGIFIGAYFDNGGWRMLVLTLSVGTTINLVLYYFLLKLFWLAQRGLRNGHSD